MLLRAGDTLLAGGRTVGQARAKVGEGSMGLGEGKEYSLTCDLGIAGLMPCWPLGHMILYVFSSPVTSSFSRSHCIVFSDF